MTITLASYNIQYGVGKDGRFDLSRIVAELGEADIIALQEVEIGNPRKGLVDQPAELSRQLGHPHWSFGAGVDIYLGESVPGGYPGLRRKFGNMILSRWPLLSVVHHTLPKRAIAGATHLQRTAMEAVIATPEGPLRLIAGHLDHISSETRQPQVTMLRDLALAPQRRGAPWVGVPGNAAGFGDPEIPWPVDCLLIGDMNFAPDGPEYRHLVCGGPTDTAADPAGRLHDCWVLTGHDAAQGVTFIRPERKQERLDHCFVTPGLVPSVRSMHIDAAALGSDHQPIFVALELPGNEAETLSPALSGGAP
ncbi:endonuclease/exonuclease/phosphatase family protein [Devosia sp.]|uniref:endonuclease/exonuclease/phosphatase family protein n=1 Tax=Devosia sp. TaxID=1871048 RepID=UPI002AFFB27C|nr:endonuclease/exonuclease/phosphatase family protein [Devosia sp.]